MVFDGFSPSPSHITLITTPIFETVGGIDIRGLHTVGDHTADPMRNSSQPDVENYIASLVKLTNERRNSVHDSTPNMLSIPKSSKSNQCSFIR